jgi:solute carrier family 25 folate transporter 32
MRYEHLAAGVTGGVLSTLVLHPLDLLKIRLAGKFVCSLLLTFPH